MKVTSRKNVEGQWDNYLPKKTVFLITGEFFTSKTRHVSCGGVDLTPITDEEKVYLRQRGLFRGKI